jgi:hypothetical protein
MWRRFSRERFVDVVLCSMYSLGYKGTASLVALLQITSADCLTPLLASPEPGKFSDLLQIILCY